VIESTDKDTLQGAVKKNVRFHSNLHTDGHSSYVGPSEQFVRETVNHSIQYVHGNVSTNDLENFFSLLKRTLHGTYVSCDAQHLFRYLDEQASRFNYRKGNDGERFLTVAGSMSNKRLTYKELIGNE
jgi:ISXO2-like transposase domain